MKSPSLGLCFSVVLSTSLLMAEDYYPDLKNGKGAEFHQMPMGCVGGVMELVYDESFAKIISLNPKGEGKKAGLKPGDQIIAVGPSRLKRYSKGGETGGDGPPRQIGLAIIKAQDEGEDLELTVLREGKKIKIKVDVGDLDDFEGKFPHRCERSERLVKMACEALQKSQERNGIFGKKRSEYSNAFAALALLATGDKNYKRNVRATAELFTERILEKGAPHNNWHCSSAGILLGEYILATGGSQKMKKALAICCEAMAKRLDPKTGRLGHSGKHLPYDGKGLVMTSVQAHIMWALAVQAGVPLDQKAWDLSYRSIKAAIGKAGCVGYNFSARGSNQSMARTAAMFTAFSLIEKPERKDMREMKNWISDEYKRSTNCHAVTSLAIVYGFMGMKHAGTVAMHRNFNYHKWLFALVDPGEKGSLYYFPKRSNWGGDVYLGLKTVGNYQIALALLSAKEDTLWMFGNRKKNWLK